MAFPEVGDILIANLTAIAIGHDAQVTTLTNSPTNKLERTIFLGFQQWRDEELAAHWWNFAKTEALLNVDTTATAWSATTTYVIGDQVTIAGRYYTAILGGLNHQPPNATYWSGTQWKFPYRYLLPTDFMQLVQLNDVFWQPSQADFVNSDVAGYRIVGAYIESLYATPLPIVYIKRVTDPALYPALFRKVVSLKIAAEICDLMTQMQEKLQSIQGRYLRAVDEAIRAAEIQEPPDTFVDDTWMQSRISP